MSGGSVLYFWILQAYLDTYSWSSIVASACAKCITIRFNAANLVKSVLTKFQEKYN